MAAIDPEEMLAPPQTGLSVRSQAVAGTKQFFRGL
jgi:hypothetical protein